MSNPAPSGAANTGLFDQFSVAIRQSDQAGSECINNWIDQGIDLTQVVNKGGNTLLHEAVRHAAFNCVRTLLEAGLDPTAQNDSTQSAMQICNEYKRQRKIYNYLAQILMEHIDPTGANGSGQADGGQQVSQENLLSATGTGAGRRTLRDRSKVKASDSLIEEAGFNEDIAKAMRESMRPPDSQHSSKPAKRLKKAPPPAHSTVPRPYKRKKASAASSKEVLLPEGSERRSWSYDGAKPERRNGAPWRSGTQVGGQVKEQVEQQVEDDAASTLMLSLKEAQKTAPPTRPPAVNMAARVPETPPEESKESKASKVVTAEELAAKAKLPFQSSDLVVVVEATNSVQEPFERKWNKLHVGIVIESLATHNQVKVALYVSKLDSVKAYKIVTTHVRRIVASKPEDKYAMPRSFSSAVISQAGFAIRQLRKIDVKSALGQDEIGAMVMVSDVVDTLTEQHDMQTASTSAQPRPQTTGGTMPPFPGPEGPSTAPPQMPPLHRQSPPVHRTSPEMPTMPGLPATKTTPSHLSAISKQSAANLEMQRGGDRMGGGVSDRYRTGGPVGGPMGGPQGHPQQLRYQPGAHRDQVQQAMRQGRMQPRPMGAVPPPNLKGGSMPQHMMGQPMPPHGAVYGSADPLSARMGAGGQPPRSSTFSHENYARQRPDTGAGPQAYMPYGAMGPRAGHTMSHIPEQRAPEMAPSPSSRPPPESAFISTRNSMLKSKLMSGYGIATMIARLQQVRSGRSQMIMQQQQQQMQHQTSMSQMSQPATQQHSRPPATQQHPRPPPPVQQHHAQGPDEASAALQGAGKMMGSAMGNRENPGVLPPAQRAAEIIRRLELARQGGTYPMQQPAAGAADNVAAGHQPQQPASRP